MSKKLPIFYSALLLTGVNLLLRMVSTSFQVYLSGKIGAAGIGLLQMVLSVGSLTMTAGMAGIRTATMYLTSEELGKNHRENIRWILSGCVKYSLFCSGTVAIVLFAFSPEIAKNWIGDTDTVVTIRLFSCFLPINCLCGVMVGYFTAANRIGTLAVVEIVEQAISMMLTIALLHFWANSDQIRSCAAIIIGSGFSSCTTLLILLVLQKLEKSKFGHKISVGKRLLKTAVPLALADDLKSGISTAENLMVPKRMELCKKIENPLASFGLVSGMVFPVLMFPAAILYGLAELLIPELARCSAAGSQQRIQYLAGRSLRIAVLYGCVFCGLLFLLSEELCVLLYNNLEAGRYLRWFSVLIPMLYCDAITDAMIKGLGQQTASVRYNILTSCMDVMLLFLLLPQYGIEGYYVSFLVTHLLNFILSVRRLLKITGKLFSWGLPIASGFGLVIAIFLSNTLANPPLKIGTFILLLGSLLYIFRVVSREDAAWLKGLVSKKLM